MTRRGSNNDWRNEARGSMPSGLGRHVARPSAPEGEIDRLKKQAWRQRGVLTIDLTDPPPQIDAHMLEVLIRLGNRIYGETEAGAGKDSTK